MGVIKGDTRSLDYSSYSAVGSSAPGPAGNMASGSFWN